MVRISEAWPDLVCVTLSRHEMWCRRRWVLRAVLTDHRTWEGTGNVVRVSGWFPPRDNGGCFTARDVLRIPVVGPADACRPTGDHSWCRGTGGGAS